MADIVLSRNIGELIDLKPLLPYLPWTAGSASDSATWTGTSIDRGGFTGGALTAGELPLSIDVDIFYSAKLASGATLSLSFDLQDSADNSAFSDFATEASAVVATGPSGGGTVSGIVRMAVPSTNVPAGLPGVDLTAARRYIRLLSVPHLSATGTDTAIIVAVGVLAGFDRLQAPAT